MSPQPPPQKKSRVWLVVLILLGVVVLIGVLVVGGAVWWFSANKERLVAMGREAEADATEFAPGHDQDACVGEALRKTDACDGIMCEAKTKIFLERCIRKATSTPGFCDGVPQQGEIMKTVTWVQEQCTKRGRAADDQKCSRVMQGVPLACQQR